MNRRAFWIPLFALLVLATGLSAALLRGAGNPNPDAVATPLTGEAAPALSLPMLDSQAYLTSNTLLGKPHLLNFFASWCGPCAEENSVLVDLSKKHDVAIIGVALKDSAEPLRHYLARRGNPYDLIALDDMGTTAIDWGVTGVPETFAINADGRIIGRITGGMSEDEAARLVQSLLPPAK